MNVAILGYAVDGISAAKYWSDLGNDITICDQKTDLQIPNWASARLGKHYLNDLHQFDLIVRSPGVHPADIVDANPETPDILNKVTTCINEFFVKCPAPIIGVTGTKGKGTSSTLIYELLKTAGKKVFLGGNIGTVPLDFLHEVTPDSWVVLELSNFQLIDFTGRPQVAVCLMLVPEHQDWHKSIEEYYGAKQQLFVSQADEDITVYNADNETSVKITAVSRGKKWPYVVPSETEVVFEKEGVYVEGDTIYMKERPVCKIEHVALLGRHNLENVCAAIAATWQIINGDTELITRVVRAFTGLEHRLEFVREVDGVKYYNDSFATTPEATVAAIKAFKEPKVLILGGHDKGIPFYDLINAVVHYNVRQAVVIGDTGEKIIELLVSRGFEKITLGGNTMTEIVQAAKNAAQPSDVVLLSNGCASFGLFQNYKDRGNQFKNAVNAL